MAYIHRRGEAFRVGFTVNGKKKFKQFRSHRAAKHFQENLGTYRATITGDGQMTVSAVAQDWLKSCRVGRDGNEPLEAGTIKTYEGYVKNYIEPAFPKTKISALTRADVKEFRDDLLAMDGIGRNTAKKILVAFRSIITHAIEIEELSVDVGARVTIKLGSRYKRNVAPPQKSIVKRMLDHAREGFERALAGSHADKKWLRYYPFLLLCCYCGLRMSEARGLPLDAVDFTSGKVQIKQRADRFNKIGPPKTAQGHRSIHMPSVVQEALRAWLTHSGKMMANDRTQLVFASNADTHTPMSGPNLRKRFWVPLLSALKVAQQSFHITRHFFASRRIELGDDLKELSEVMGHADPAFTLRVYGHLFKDPLSEKRRKERAEELVL